MNRSPRNARLLFAAFVTFGVFPMLYAWWQRRRAKPKSWTVEQREKNRLSVQYDRLMTGYGRVMTEPVEAASGVYEHEQERAA